MDGITISTDMLIGLFMGVAVPLLIFGLRMYTLVKQTRDMHLAPDEHGFGSGEIKALMEEHFSEEETFHREYVNSIKALRYAMKELTHFTKWSVTERTGKEPPPYVRID